MADVIKTLKAGDSLPTDARIWNQVLGNVMRSQSGLNSARDAAPLDLEMIPGVVWVKNTLDIPIKLGSPVGIGYQSIDGAGKVPVFEIAPIYPNGLLGSTSGGDYAQQWGIATEPIAVDRVGRVQVTGLCLARVQTTYTDIDDRDANHMAAFRRAHAMGDPTNDIDYLTLGFAGKAAVMGIWEEETEEPRLMWVDMTQCDDVRVLRCVLVDDLEANDTAQALPLGLPTEYVTIAAESGVTTVEAGDVVVCATSVGSGYLTYLGPGDLKPVPDLPAKPGVDGTYRLHISSGVGSWGV